MCFVSDICSLVVYDGMLVLVQQAIFISWCYCVTFMPVINIWTRLGVMLNNVQCVYILIEVNGRCNPIWIWFFYGILLSFGVPTDVFTMNIYIKCSFLNYLHCIAALLIYLFIYLLMVDVAELQCYIRCRTIYHGQPPSVCLLLSLESPHGKLSLWQFVLSLASEYRRLSYQFNSIQFKFGLVIYPVHIPNYQAVK